MLQGCDCEVKSLLTLIKKAGMFGGFLWAIPWRAAVHLGGRGRSEAVFSPMPVAMREMDDGGLWLPIVGTRRAVQRGLAHP